MIIEHLSIKSVSGYMDPWLGLKQKYCDKMNRMNARQVFRYLDKINALCKEHNTVRSVEVFIEYSPDPFAQNLTLARWDRSILHLGAMPQVAHHYRNRGFPLFTGHLDDHHRKTVLVDFYSMY